MATLPAVGSDLKTDIIQFFGYSSKKDKQFREDGWITEGENMALEEPVGARVSDKIATRLGYSLCNQTAFSADKCQGIKIFKVSTDLFYRVMVAAEGKLWEAQFTDPLAPLTFAQVTGITLSLTKKVRMTTFLDKLFIVDSEHEMQSYYFTADPITGTITVANTVSITLPDNAIPSIIALYNNRLWVDDVGKNVIYFSCYNDPTNWNYPSGSPAGDAGIQYFRGYPDEIESITAFGVYSNSLLVQQLGRSWLFVTNGAPYNATGEITWQIKELQVDVGSVNQEVLSDVGEKVIYLTKRGVHDLSGIQALSADQVSTIDTINAQPLSFDIEPDIFGCNWDNAASVFTKFYYILNLKDSAHTHNNRAFVYDTRRKLWYTPWTNYNFSCFDKVTINGAEYCFAGSDINGKVYTLFTSTMDDSVKIPSWFVTNAMYHQRVESTKTFRKLYFQPTTEGSRGIYVSYSVDYAPWVNISVEWTGQSRTGFVLGTSILGTGRLGNGFFGRVMRFISINRRGIHCRIKFSNNNTGNTGGMVRFGIVAMTLKSYLENEETRENM